MRSSKSRQRRQPVPRHFRDSARWGQSYREDEQRRLAELSRQLTLQLNRATTIARQEVAKT